LAYIETDIYVNAPIELCFDMARDISLHSETVWAHTKERAVGGVVSGVIGLGQEVTFEARHFGIRQRLTARVIEFDRPYVFAEVMLKGAFKTLKHTHMFEVSGNGTLMKDVLVFTSPFGMIGKLFEAVVLERYMKAFLVYRQRKLKELIKQRIQG